MKAIKDHDEFCPAVAEVSSETENERSRGNIRREQEEAEREKQKAAIASQEERQRVALLPIFTAHAVKYSNRENVIQHDEFVKEITGECKVVFLENSSCIITI